MSESTPESTSAGEKIADAVDDTINQAMRDQATIAEETVSTAYTAVDTSAIAAEEASTAKAEAENAIQSAETAATAAEAAIEHSSNLEEKVENIAYATVEALEAVKDEVASLRESHKAKLTPPPQAETKAEHDDVEPENVTVTSTAKTPSATEKPKGGEKASGRRERKHHFGGKYRS